MVPVQPQGSSCVKGCRKVRVREGDVMMKDRWGREKEHEGEGAKGRGGSRRGGEGMGKREGDLEILRC